MEKKISITYDQAPTIIPIQAKISAVLDLSDNAYLAGGKKFGAIDEYGKLFMPLQYDIITALSETLFVGKQSKRMSSFLDLYRIDGTCLIDGKARNCTEMRKFYDNRAACRLDKKWGYIDENGAMAIPASFDSCGDFAEGKAFAIEGDRVFCIDGTGYKLFEVPGTDAYRYHEGYAVFAAANGKKGVLDTGGNIVIPPEYTDIDHCQNGLFPFRHEKHWGVMDVQQRVIVGDTHEKVIVEQDRIKYGFYIPVTRNNALTVALVYGSSDLQSNAKLEEKYLELKEPSEGYAAFRTYEAGKVAMGYITPDGRVAPIIDGKGTAIGMHSLLGPDVSDYLTSYSEGLAFVKLYNVHYGKVKNAKYVVIDANQRPVSDAGFDSVIWGFRGGYACVTEDANGQLIIDKQLRPMTQKYMNIQPEKYGRYIARQWKKQGRNAQFDILDEQLRVIATIPSVMPADIAMDDDGIIEARPDGKLMYFDRDGRVIRQTDFEVGSVYTDADYASAQNVFLPQKLADNIWLCRDENGQPYQKISPKESRLFTDGAALFRQGPKMGAIDTNGNVIVSPAYDLIWPFNNGRATAVQGKQFYIIRRNPHIAMQG